MSLEKKSFEVTVKGQYQALGDHTGIPTLKPYQETFVLPSQEAALSNICKHLLSPRLKKVHADFIRFRTHDLVNIRLLNYIPNREVLQMGIDDMNILELHDFCILRQLMIDPYKHAGKDIFFLRAMVQKAYSEKRAAEKEKSTSTSGQNQKEADALRAANDLPPTETDPVININEQKLSKDARQTAASAAPAAVAKAASEAVESMEPLPAPESDEPVLE